ncbi:hypothetical protein SAMN02745129_1453 [Ferrimonas marina]|uniref:Uncharacterized protein n=1 Tax=Ferrimonas marina TaxID=299255 RepID=A0A1M5R2B8_9GAMM|nr:hypothetical protein SAMN02745129_1453 [Ferrimonas marina]
MPESRKYCLFCHFVRVDSLRKGAESGSGALPQARLPKPVSNSIAAQR